MFQQGWQLRATPQVVALNCILSLQRGFTCFDRRLRRRHDLGVILFRALGCLDLAAQQLGKLEQLAGAARPAMFCIVMVTRLFVMAIRYCIATSQNVLTTNWISPLGITVLTTR